MKMKHLATLTLLSSLLVACAGGNYKRDIASINAERNSAQAQVTTASLEQARMQRVNILEESILARQQQALENQARQESSNVVTGAIGGFFDATIGTVGRVLNGGK